MNPLEHVKKEPYKLYINGEFLPSKSEEIFDVINPVRNEVFAQAYLGGSEDVDLAIKAAREAFDKGPWKDFSPRDRSNLLLKAADILEKRKEEFAVLETLECGKLYGSALYYEAEMAVDALRYFAGKARTIEGKVVQIDKETLNFVDWYPQGVIGEILPWNGPFMMGCQKISAMLAAGNTVVVKPSSWAALTMLLMAEVFHEAGFPAGVVNVVTGPGSTTGLALVESHLVDMVSMTGGTETGKRIIKASSESAKEIALEMGGKSPLIIFDDVDLKEAIKWGRHAFTLNSGQVCVSGTRLFVQRGIYEKLLEGLKEESEAFVPGDGFDFATSLSTLIHKDHAATVWDYIESGKKEGARLVCGGEAYEDEELARGNFVPMTVFADVTPDMKIFKEEIFGPVLSVSVFDTEEEAIELANNTDFGLAGGVFSKDIKRALRVAARIRGGQIYVNTYFSKGMIESPGTGWKQSGIGVAGIQKYMISKTTFVDLKDGSLPPV